MNFLEKFNLENVNWVNVIIKVVIILVILLIITLIGYKIFFKDDSSYIDDNLDKMYYASLEYYEGDNLPQEIGDVSTLTLEKMLEEDLIDVLVDSKDKKCDQTASYAEVTKTKDKVYSLYVTVVCGDDSSFIEETIDKTTKEKTDEKETKKEDQSGKKLYYEYAKVNNEYGAWTQGTKSGDGYETKTENVTYSTYCAGVSISYHHAVYIPASSSNGYSFSYELKLLNVPSNAISVSLQGNYYGNVNDYLSCLNGMNKNLSTVSNSFGYATSTLSDPSMLKNCSLKQGNFTFNISNPYKNGSNYYVKVSINVANASGVNTYTSAKLGKKVYFIPIYLTGSYVNQNQCIKDLSSNSSRYSGYAITNTWNESISYYRTVTKNVDKSDTKWSTETSLEGYEATGKKEYR